MKEQKQLGEKTNVFLHPDETWDRVFRQLNRIEDLIKDCGSEIKRISTLAERRW